MATSDKLTVREGLVQVVSAERFQTKPLSGSNTHVVVMEKTGSALRHYCTLTSPQAKLSIGEQLWGNYVCYVVDLSSRELHIEQEFPIQDRINKIKVSADIVYHAENGERVAIGVEDALASLREDLTTVLKREIVRFAKLDDIVEEHLEARLQQASTGTLSRLGIAIEKARVRADWPEEVLARRRAALEKVRAQREQDAQRARDQRLQDEDRRRAESLEVEDIEHIDQVIQKLGLTGLPADIRLRLHAMPRKEAYSQIIKLIEDQRAYAREVMGRRMQEEYALLKKMIDDKVLEEMDLVEFGKNLLDRYSHSLAIEETFGMPSPLLFGDAPRAKLGEGKAEEKGLPDQPSGGTDTSSKDNAGTASNPPVDNPPAPDKG